MPQPDQDLRPPARDGEPPDDGFVASAVPFGQALAFWFKLGWISFGGPAGQIALLQQEVVERRRWIGQRRFLHALNFCMLLPGPEAQQLATYVGWLLHRTWGGVAAGVLFVLPSLLLLIGLSWLVVTQGHQPLVAALLAGIKPAVVALVAVAAWRIGRRVLGHPLLWAVAAAAFVALRFLGLPFALILLGAALVGGLGARVAPQAFGVQPSPAGPPAPVAGSGVAWRPAIVILLLWASSLGALVLAFGSQATLVQMGWFFTQAALMTFGGAYAVLPFVMQGAVEQHQWLSAAQMMDGLALGETTPGPLIMVVAYVGFLGGWSQALFGAEQRLLAGAVAALVVTWFTFLPSFLFILAGAPWVERTRARASFAAPLAAITAAVVGVVLDLALFFAQQVVWPQGLQAGFDGVAGLTALVAALLLARAGWGVVPVLALCAGLGLLRSLA